MHNNDGGNRKREKPKGHCWAQKKKKKKPKINIFVDQKCKALSWANAAAYQALSVKAAGGKWKFSSGLILGLKCSIQNGDKTQQCY